MNSNACESGWGNSGCTHERVQPGGGKKTTPIGYFTIGTNSRGMAARVQIIGQPMHHCPKHNSLGENFYRVTEVWFRKLIEEKANKKKKKKKWSEHTVYQIQASSFILFSSFYIKHGSARYYALLF